MWVVGCVLGRRLKGGPFYWIDADALGTVSGSMRRIAHLFYRILCGE